MKKISLISLFVVALVGCNQKAQIDQSKMCMYSTDDEAKQCKSGELSWYSPKRWGSEQLPLSAAVAYCDFNYEVMYNNSGVICVFTDKRLSLVN
jgi:hypothetical protein